MTHQATVRFGLRACTWVWVVLLALTFTTFLIGKLGYGGVTTVSFILLLTFIKTELVASFFMGLRQAPLLWRLVMLAYLLIVGGGIALAYILGSNA